MGIEAQPVRETIVRFRLTADERARDHRFFTAMAAVCATVVFVGFAPTYYLRSFSARPPLSPLVHLHAAVSTGWILLFLTQSSLVAARRVEVHRRLGIAGALLAGVVLVVGWLTAIDARAGAWPRRARRRSRGSWRFRWVRSSFAVLAAAGLWNRRRSETHKRFMLLATIAILTPALARYRFYGIGDGPLTAIFGTLALIAVCLIYDAAKRAAQGRYIDNGKISEKLKRKGLKPETKYRPTGSRPNSDRSSDRSSERSSERSSGAWRYGPP